MKIKKIIDFIDIKSRILSFLMFLHLIISFDIELNNPKGVQ